MKMGLASDLILEVPVLIGQVCESFESIVHEKLRYWIGVEALLGWLVYKSSKGSECFVTTVLFCV